jgi:SAM-dependent methyltransferase
MIQNSAASSFRDPAGQLLQIDGRILRLVRTIAVKDLELLLSSHRFGLLFESGHLVPTSVLDLEEIKTNLRPRGVEVVDESECGMVLEHEKIPFVSFPAEWPPEMLHAAGMLTLELAEESLHEGFGLKDATPYNVLFRGTEPVFIDILSFEKRIPGDPTWLAYAQFVRTFLLPLFVNNHFKLSLDKFFLSRRDGIEPEKVYRMASPFRRLMPPFLHLVSIPVWLSRRLKEDDVSIYQPHLLANPEKAAFILSSLFRRLKKRLDRVRPSERQNSVWSDYLACNNNYTDEHFRAKCAFVESALTECKPVKALDVGCNTGHFSAIAARCGASVVAIDYDPVVVGEVWRNARMEKLDILPLVVNLTRPTPALGWRNSETASFLERATGAFDAVLMLAVIHHMLVTESIPLSEIIKLAAQLTTDVLIIEFVSPLDSMFIRLTRGRGALYADLSKEVFERECSSYFEISAVQHLDSTSRWLYFMRKKN